MSRLAPLALLLSALTAQAAPLPARGAPDIARYLPDDTDFVLVLNAKQVLTSPLFTGHYEKLVREGLKHPQAQAWLKGTGLDPLEDVERVVVCTGKGAFPDDPEEFRKGAGPLILLLGKFDPARLHARMAGLAKEGDDKVLVHGEGEGKFYELKALLPVQSTFLVVGKDVLIVSMRRERAERALARVTGKTKPNPKYKEVADFVQGLDPDAAAQALALGSSIWGTTVSNRFECGRPVTTVTHTTLADAGITRLRGALRVTEAVAGSGTLQAADEKAAKALTDQMKGGLAEATRELERMAGDDETVKALLEAFRGVKVEAKGSEVGVQFQGGAKALQGAFRLLFSAGAASAPPPAPRPVEKDS